VEDSNGGTCWGLAYRVPDEEIESTVSYLNLRESAGYRKEQVEFHPDDGSPSFPIHVYISVNDADNIYFTGHTEVDEIVQTIVQSRGNSGTNLEYALRLADCQRRLAPHFEDDHLFEIEARLLTMCREISDPILWKLGHKKRESIKRMSTNNNF
jgi:cation transport regulator ChaC